MKPAAMSPESKSSPANLQTLAARMPWQLHLVIVAVAYYLGAQLGSSLTMPGTNVSLVWPPVGIALAAMLLLGYRIWPAIAVAAFATNLPFFLAHHPPVTAVAIGSVQTTVDVLEVALSYYLLRRFTDVQQPFDKVAQVVRFIGVIAAAQAVSAAFSVAHLFLWNGSWAAFYPTWASYWISNMVSIFLIVPFISIWHTSPMTLSRKQALIRVLVYFFTAVTVFGVFQFGGWAVNDYFEYFTFLFLLWTVFTLGFTGTTAVVLIIAAISIWSTAQGHGPFIYATPSESLLILQAFLATLTFTGLLLAAALAEREHSESALRASEQLYRSLVDVLPEGVALSDLEGNITFVSQQLLSVYGSVAAESALGTNALQWIAPESREKARINIQKRGQDLAVPDNEYILLKEDGTRFFGEIDGALLTDAAGHPRGLVTVHRDITNRKKVEQALRESEERFQLFLEYSPIYVFFKDQNIRPLHLSKNFEKMLGKPLGELLGKNMNDLFPSELAQSMVADDERVLREGKTIEIEETFNGHAYSTIKFPVFRNGQPSFLAGFTTDITEKKQYAEALAKSDAKIRTYLELASVIMLAIDVDGRITMINRMGCEVLGGTEEEIVGQNWFGHFLPERVRAEAREKYRQLLNGAASHEYFEYEIHARGGSERIIAWHNTLLTDDHGQVSGTLSSGEDITARRQIGEALRLSEARYRSIFENAVEGIFQSSPNGRYITVNPAMARLFGYETPQEMLAGITDIKTQVYVNQEQRQVFMQTLGKESAIFDFEAQNYRRDGSILWISCNARVVRDANGEVLYYEGTLVDITGRKRAEEEVRRLNLELEQRVIERTAQLEASNKELESFSYSVSHDLRAPLRAIDGFSRILQDEYLTTLPPEAARLLDSVRNSARNMGQLIDDLLKFSRLSRHPLNKQSIQPETLIQEAFNTLRHEQGERRIEITLGDLPTCQGDPSLLLQVWINLLANALKFTRHQEVARIEIGCQTGTGESVYFVKDNGVGFDMQYSNKLFGVFQRLHSVEEFEGTGVGLALVQRIITRHGGKIWAEARPGEGATFYFTV